MSVFPIDEDSGYYYKLIFVSTIFSPFRFVSVEMHMNCFDVDYLKKAITHQRDGTVYCHDIYNRHTRLPVTCCRETNKK